MTFDMSFLENIPSVDMGAIYALDYNILSFAAIVLLVLFALLSVFETARTKKALQDTLAELCRYAKIAKNRKSQITILKAALDKAVDGKYRHPHKGYFISKEEFYACYDIKE